MRLSIQLQGIGHGSVDKKGRAASSSAAAGVPLHKKCNRFGYVTFTTSTGNVTGNASNATTGVSVEGNECSDTCIHNNNALIASSQDNDGYDDD